MLLSPVTRRLFIHSFAYCDVSLIAGADHNYNVCRWQPTNPLGKFDPNQLRLSAHDSMISLMIRWF